MGLGPGPIAGIAIASLFGLYIIIRALQPKGEGELKSSDQIGGTRRKRKKGTRRK
jgi:hypothetical protein